MRSLRDTFVFGRYRTLLQDAEAGVHQLVEIAVRALSPGINDPFTAVSCIDRLGGALVRLADRPFPERYRFDHDHDDKLRAIANTTSFSGFVDSAFDQIRQNAGTSVAVNIRLLEVLASRCRFDEQRTSVREHAGSIRDAALRAFEAECDRRDVEERYAAVIEAIRSGR